MVLITGLLNRFFRLSAFLAVLSISLLSACTNPPELSVSLEQISSLGNGNYSISLLASLPLDKVELLDSSGSLLSSIAINKLKSVDTILNIEEAALPLLAICSAGEEEFQLTIKLAEQEQWQVRISSPLNNSWAEDSPLTIIAAEPINCLIQSRVAGDIALIADGLLLSLDGETWHEAISWRSGEAEEAEQFLLKTMPDSQGELALVVEIDGIEKVRMPLVSASLAELAAGIKIGEMTMPTDSLGNERRDFRQGYLELLQDSGIGPGSGVFLHSYQKVEIENRAAGAVSLIVRSKIIDSEGEVAFGFELPATIPGDYPVAGLEIDAGGTATVILPIYADASKVAAGKYRRVIELMLAGSGHLLATAEAELQVVNSAALAEAVTWIVVMITAVVALLLFFRGRQFLYTFSVRQIVLVSLISAAMVVLVNIPAYFLTSITVFLLGPLGFLVDGLLSEYIFYVLLTALVVMIPRPGTVLLAVGVRFLLGGVLLGMLTPLGMMHSSITALSLELALWLALKTSSLFRESGKISPAIILFFATANALVSWVGFQLSIVIFRLHYSDWYIFLSVGIGGFIYSLIGTSIGRKLGDKLARVMA